MHVLIVDDHIMFREGLAALILREHPATHITEAGTLVEAQRLLDDIPGRPDLVLLDLNLDRPHTDETVREAMLLFAEIPVVALSGVTDPRTIRDVIEAGAMGFIPKSLSYEEFSIALTRSLAGRVYLPKASLVPLATMRPLVKPNPDSATKIAAIDRLTERQREVLCVLARGWNNRTIADHLHISTETVKSHLTQIFTTLNVNSRTEAVYLLAQVENLSPSLSNPANADPRY